MLPGSVAHLHPRLADVDGDHLPHLGHLVAAMIMTLYTATGPTLLGPTWSTQGAAPSCVQTPVTALEL